MAKRNYGFVRSYASLGRDLDDIQDFLAAGYGGVLFDYNDPYLAQAIHDVQQAGIPFGIWGDPGHNTANQFVSRMADLYKRYNPEILVPDIEFVGKGYAGSPGWEYNEQMARMWQQMLGNARTAVTVMPMQRDFNYEAWQKYNPNVEWLPQAYGANPNTDVFNPKDIVQTLIDRGVDPAMISPLLGRGHDGRFTYGGSGLWTLDDYKPAGIAYPKAFGPETPSTASGGSAAPTSGTKPPSGQPQKSNRLGRGATQTGEMIRKQGLMWGGQTFTTQKDFASYLKSRGRSYATWAAQHQPAAQALKGR